MACLSSSAWPCRFIAPPPQLSTPHFAGATVKISADRGWTLLPGQCATLSWQLEGIESLYVNGVGKAGADQLIFCPSPGDTRLDFAIRAGGSSQSELRVLSLHIHSLFIYALASLVCLGLALPLAIALWFLAGMRLDAPVRVDAGPPLMLVALFLLGILLQAAQPSLLEGLAAGLGDIFKRPAWHALGSLLAALLFISLALKLWRGSPGRRRDDLVALGAFFAVALMLFAQAGFDSIGQWEIWPMQAYFEGRPSKLETELISRFWALAPHVLATSISRHSFVGYHLVNLLMFWGMLALFYAILRQLGLAPWLACLAAILFLVYPVNASLMSLRSLLMNFNKLSLLAAVFLALDCRAGASRLGLLGMWLALLLALGTGEYGFVIILVVPLLWWRAALPVWQRLNLTAVWALAPVLKVMHLQLLNVAGVSYYGDWNFASSGGFSLESVAYHLDVIANAYLRTIVYGWQEALGAVSQNQWWLASIATLIIVGAAAAWLARDSSGEELPSPRQSALILAGGLLFIMPSIGVIMWVARRAYGFWRMYVFVPLGAAIALLALILLASLVLSSLRRRQALVIALCLAVIVPGLSRLYAQQAWYISSANAKAHVLMQIVEQAPWFEPDARLMIVTSMSSQDLRDRGIKELHANMLDSAIYMLYQQGRPGVAFLCLFSETCGSSDIDISSDFLASGDDYDDVVIFRLHEDLRTELLMQAPDELLLQGEVNYEPSRLIDFSAPLPPRALTMLSAADASLPGGA